MEPSSAVDTAQVRHAVTEPWRHCREAMFLAQQARQLVGACAAGNLTLAKRVALSFYHPNCSPLALAMSGSMSCHGAGPVHNANE
jgi:hypothetical protein